MTTANMDRPPVATTEGQEIHHNTKTTEARSFPAQQAPEDPRGVLANALVLAARGVAILPCHTINGRGVCTCYKDDCPSPGKHPRTKDGSEDATTDRDVILGWWRRWSGKLNFGQTLADRCVVDVDTNDGKTGAETLEALEAEHGQLAPTLTYRTGRGGTQYVYAWPEDADHEAYGKSLGDYVDFKHGATQYVMVPGSRTEGIYETLTDMPPAPVPGWVLGAAPRAAGGSSRAYHVELPRVPDSLAECRTLADCLLLPRDHPERGDDWLTKVAGFEAQDVRNVTALFAKLRAYNAGSDDPMDDGRVQKIAESVWRREQAKGKDLVARAARGEISMAEVIESWDDFEERVRDDFAGMLIRDRATALYTGHLLSLMERDPAEYDASPFAKVQLFKEAAKHRAQEQAKVLAAPGNKDLGRPSRRGDCAGVVFDTTAPGLFLQPGWISLFMADYEVGKTMVLYSLAVDRLRRGEEVIVIQEDETSDQTWGKMDAFCLTPDEEDRFQPYNYPGWNLAANPEMLDRLIERHPGASLIIVDSVAKLLRLAGLEEDNPGSLALWTVFERFIARHPGVAVALIDHQGHAGGGHARGATVKAQQSSIVVQISSVTKFARDRDGQIKATIHKHRNGESTGHTWRGDVIVRKDDEPLRIEWADEGVKARGGGGSGKAAEDDPMDGIKGAELGILKLLKPTLGSEDVWVTKTEIDTADKRHPTTVTRSIAKLIDAGYLAEKPGWKPSDGPKSYRRLK